MAKNNPKIIDPKSKSSKENIFEHKMQLSLSDAYGVSVPDTKFWITLIIVKEKIKNSDVAMAKITIQIPAINFYTGLYANSIYETANPSSEIIDKVPGNFLPPPQNGGYLYTTDNFLSKDLRPNELLNLSYFAASNNGNNTAFFYKTNPNPPPAVSSVKYPDQIPGYMLQITNAGGLVVQGLGTLGNIIPPGSHSLLPTTISYLVKPKIKLAHHGTQISRNEINTAVFPFTSTNFAGAQLGLRDSHVNDAFDNVVAFAWADNSNVPDQANNSNTMNLSVAMGKVKNKKLKMRDPIFIPTPSNHYVWDTAIAINRKNKKNIVVSWLLIDNNSPNDGQPTSVVYRAVSNDGGKTWPVNSPTNIQPIGFIKPNIPGGAGDNRGVAADIYGNFWYLTTSLFDVDGNFVNVPFIMVSSDNGITYEIAHGFPEISPKSLYDFPQMCFGGDGQGNYGVYIIIDYFPNDAIDSNGFPVIGFIPITGLGKWGTAKQTFLPHLLNNIFTASITASIDGRVWTYGSMAGLSPAAFPFPGTSINNTRLVFKSPGPLDSNYVGPWSVITFNAMSESLYIPTWSSQPVFGMFQTVQNNIYDDKRKALYVLLNARTEIDSNSMIYFLISRNNGQSWSNPIELSNTFIGNRGFPSMSLDVVTGNLVIGWYDGRKYANRTGLNYYGAVIDSDLLTKLVDQIPLSNPLYNIPPFLETEINELHIPIPSKISNQNSIEPESINVNKKIPSRLHARLNIINKPIKKI